jgi:GLPGLI family protein
MEADNFTNLNFKTMRVLLISCLCVLSLTCFGQANIVVVNGSTLGNAGSKLAPKVLENATLKCYYLFSKRKLAAEKPYRTDTMVLDIGSTFSRFYDPARLGRDSILNAAMKGISAANIKSVSVFKGDNTKDLSNMLGTVSSDANAGESYQIYKDKAAYKVTVIDYIASGSDKFRYEDELGILPWKISESTDTILNYTCQKATLSFRGRNYTAWFAPEIPVNDGPWKFMGLPGLILKVEDDQQLFSFVLAGLQQMTTPSPILIDDPKANIKCTRAEFEKQKKKQGNGQQFNMNGGNLIIAELPGKVDYKPMEIE